MNNIKFAGLWKRLIAFWIDWAITVLLVSVIMIVFDFNMDYKAMVFFISFLCYNIIFEASKLQGTLGKRLVGIEVIKTDGGKPNFRSAITRNISKIISTLPFYTGFIRILAPHIKQTFHDQLAKSLVVVRLKKTS